MTADYTALDPAGAGYYRQRREEFEYGALKPYDELIAQIRATAAGTPIGASESIIEGIAGATGLDLVTPKSFVDAVSEGAEPTPRDRATVDDQLADGRVAVFVYNRQNATPDVDALVDAAEANGIPVVAVTETPSPAGATFQQWQVSQLQRLADALAKAGR
jgi:zinc/manganese transport system substrate-binding protein